MSSSGYNLRNRLPAQISEDVKPVEPVATPITCILCEVVFRQRQNLRRHMRNVHLADPWSDESCRTRKLGICIECHENFLTVGKLTEHLAREHNLKFQQSEMDFNSFSDFLGWKTRMEQIQKVTYVQRTGPSKVSAGKIRYLHCNRSGIKKQRQSSEPMTRKSPGTIKMNRYCTSFMRVLEKKYGRVHVVFHSTHYGHDDDKNTSTDICWYNEPIPSSSTNRVAKNEFQKTTISTKKRKMHSVMFDVSKPEEDSVEKINGTTGDESSSLVTELKLKEELPCTLPRKRVSNILNVVRGSKSRFNRPLLTEVKKTSVTASVTSENLFF